MSEGIGGVVPAGAGGVGPAIRVFGKAAAGAAASGVVATGEAAEPAGIEFAGPPAVVAAP